jgi:hypothetical protein
MEKKELTIEGPVIAGNTRIYVAAESRITCDSIGDGLMCSGTRTPTYILTISDSERRAFTAEGEEVTMERLVQEVPNMADLLEFRGSGL